MVESGRHDCPIGFRATVHVACLEELIHGRTGCCLQLCPLYIVRKADFASWSFPGPAQRRRNGPDKGVCHARRLDRGRLREREVVSALRAHPIGMRRLGLASRTVCFHSACRFFRILFASGSLISTCRGTDSIIPVLGLIQRECEIPSRFK